MAVLKDGTIVINEWTKGISENPLTGFQDMVNVDIHTTPGVLKIGFAPTKISGSTATSLIKWGVMPSKTPNPVYFYDTGAKLYSYDYVNNTFSLVSDRGDTGYGAVEWKDHMFVVTVNDIDVYGPLSGSASWTDAFKTLDTVTNKGVNPMFVGQDDVLYIGNGNNLASITNFAAGSPPTGTLTQSALDIPVSYFITSLEELGKNLLVGAKQYDSGPGYTNYVGDIFPWDRSSPSFSIPIQTGSGQISTMINKNNTIVLSAGKTGKFLITNGSSTQNIFQLKLIDLPVSGEVVVKSGSVDIVDDEILFGVSNTTTENPVGVYGFRNGAWTRREISTGSDGSSNLLEIGAILGVGNATFLVAWNDNGTYGVDYFGLNGYRYTGYAAKVRSDFYRVGTALQKKQFTNASIYLTEPLSTGQGIRLSYRTSLSDSFTTVATIDYTTYGAITSFTIPAGIPETDQVQIQIELTTGSNSTTTPHLREVIIE